LHNFTNISVISWRIT